VVAAHPSVLLAYSTLPAFFTATAMPFLKDSNEGSDHKFFRMYPIALRKIASPIPSSGTFSRVQRGWLTG
jgi:hypothetical protein